MTNVQRLDERAYMASGRRRERTCGEAGFQYEIAFPSWERVEQQMHELDKQVEAEARKQYERREIYPLDWCYQLDATTFISMAAFERILGEEQTHYMLWKNRNADVWTTTYWELPEVVDCLLERSIADGDGNECCFTDAQPIDYARSCTFTPGEMLRRQKAEQDVEHAADDGLNYALYKHPDVDVIECAGHAVFVSSRNPSRAVRVEYRGDTWIMQAFERYRPWGIPVRFDWRDIPCERFDTEYRRRFQSAKSAFDYAIDWVDDEVR